MSKLKLWSCVSILLSVSLVGFDPVTVHAETPDISETEWTLTASIIANVKKIGKVTLKEPMMLYIGPNTEQQLDDLEWKWIDSQGDALLGTYHERQDKLGKGFYHFEPTNLPSYMEKKIENAAGGTPISDIIVGSPSGNLYPKAKNNNKGLNLTLNCTFKTDLSANFDGNTVETKLTLNLKGKGLQSAQEASIAGSQWNIPIKIVSALKKVGKQKEVGSLNLQFGPNLDLELADNEYLVTDDEDTEFRGAYTPDKKKIILSGLDDEFQILLVEMVEEALGEEEDIYSFDDVQVQITKLEASATVKPGISVKLKIIVKFNASATVNGALETSSGSLTVTGNGAPAS